MKLALALGMTEQEMLGRMNSREYARWLAFFRIFPFPEERADWRAAMLATVQANTMRDNKTRPYKIKDFLLDFISDVKKQTPEQMKNIVKLFVRVHNSSKAGRE